MIAGHQHLRHFQPAEIQGPCVMRIFDRAFKRRGIGERIAQHRFFLPHDSRNVARYGVYDQRCAKFAARQHEIPDRDFRCCQVLDHAFIDAFVASANQYSLRRFREAKRFGFLNSETPCFVGRAVAALAADPELARWSGGVYSSWGLSETYGFTDLDGRRPNIWPDVAETTTKTSQSPRAAVQWRLARATDG